MRTQKEIRSATHKKNLQGPMKFTRTQMWVDLIRAGADGGKLDGKSNRILLELWQQLKPEQQFQPLRPKRQSYKSGLCVCKTSCWRVSQPHLSPHRKVIGEHGMIERKVKVSALRDQGGLEATWCNSYPLVSCEVNIQCILALADTGAECSLIYGNPE